jgi:cytochrome c oxidase subunit 2
MNDLLNLLPDWSAHGHRIDALIGALHWLMLVLFVGWGAYFLFVLFRFRAGGNPKADYHGAKGTTSRYVEIAVVLAEVVLLVGFAFPIWSERVAEFPAEDESVRVRVIGEQFAWNFHYPGADGVFGRTAPELVDTAANPVGLDRDDPAAADDITTINNLYMPVDQPVIVYLSSKDVIHNFYVPFLRVKHDAIPGQTIPLHFVATQTGDTEIGCAQLCGLGHYRMKGFVHIQSQADFATWLDEQAAELAAGAAG